MTNASGKPPPSDYHPAFTSYDSFLMAAIGPNTPKSEPPQPSGNNHRGSGGWFDGYKNPLTPKPIGTPTPPARKPNGW